VVVISPSGDEDFQKLSRKFLKSYFLFFVLILGNAGSGGGAAVCADETVKHFAPFSISAQNRPYIWGLLIADCGFRISDCGSAGHGVRSAEYRLPFGSSAGSRRTSSGQAAAEAA